MLALYRVLIAVLALLKAGVQEKEAPFVVVDAAYGADSSVTSAQVSLAKDQASWNRMWAQHRGTSGANLPNTIRLADDRPPVDFRKNVVVGIFGGTTEGVEGYVVAAVATDAKSAFVRFAPVPPPLPMPNPRVAQPYGFVILPRTKLRLEIQLPAGRDRWRTVARFEPTVETKGAKEKSDRSER
jgi:hypothetical protein